MRGLRGQGIELFGHSEALFSLLNYPLSFLAHVHELDPDQRIWASGSIETKTYGKDAPVRECEEKRTFPRRSFFGKDTNEVIEEFKALYYQGLRAAACKINQQIAS
jgi:hypothetical protein